MHNNEIEYPYLPEGKQILYVSGDNEYMKEAQVFAKEHSTDSSIQTGAVIVKDGEIIGYGANQTVFNKPTKISKTFFNVHKRVCIRRISRIKSGEHYWLCPGCASPKQHAEQRAVRDAIKNTINSADLYLWGHWWCCEPCWNSMIDAGIRNVYLMEGSEKDFK